MAGIAKLVEIYASDRGVSNNESVVRIGSGLIIDLPVNQVDDRSQTYCR